jgi:hypothetical protein
LAFRAELSTNGAERLELVRAQRALMVRLQNGTDALASMHNCINTEVRFRALLTVGGTESLQLARV